MDKLYKEYKKKIKETEWLKMYQPWLKWQKYLLRHPINKISDLSKIGVKYGTDKAGPEHNYTEVIYSPLLLGLKHEPINILEIGSGDIGASLKMWREYFPNATIYCLEPFFCKTTKVTPQYLRQCSIKVFKGNQLSRDDLHGVASMPPDGFDVIVDDGAHNHDAHQISLGTLFPYLRSKGVYIIEDLHSAGDRAARLRDVNQWLDSSDIIDRSQVIYHKHDISIMDSITHMSHRQGYRCKSLTQNERDYLTQNIKNAYFINDGLATGIYKAAVIEKKKDNTKKQSLVTVPKGFIHAESRKF